MSRPRFRPRTPPPGWTEKPHETPASVPQEIRPCWQCHWYGYMQDGYAAACVNPGGPGSRGDAIHGCSMYELEPCMDIGALVPMPPPTHPGSALARRVQAEREALEAIYSRIRGSKQPWDKRHKIISRTGRLSEKEE